MSPLDVATGYLNRGWTVIPVPFRKKRPVEEEWQKMRLSADDLPAAFDKSEQNVGVSLGEPSQWLTDVDLDCQEAIDLAARLLPDTLTFGRASKPRSHWLYLAENSKTLKFTDSRRLPVLDAHGVQMLDKEGKPKTKFHMLVELRSTGAQTVFPGSVHECGEPIEFSTGSAGDPSTVTAAYLSELVARLACACLIKRHSPGDLDVYLENPDSLPAELPADVDEKCCQWLRISRPKPPVAVRSAPALEVFEDARREFNADHSMGATRKGGKCPAPGCEGSNTFKLLPDSDTRASCFHDTHPPACGGQGNGCRVFDALDLEAFTTGKTAREILVDRHYLQPYIPREEPPAPSDDDCPPELRVESESAAEQSAPSEPDPKRHIRLAIARPSTIEVAISSNTNWLEPESLDTELLPVMQFSPDLLPEALRPWLLDGANRAQTPLEFVAIPAMVALGSVIGRQVAIRPLQRDDWQEFANLWGVLVGPPSEMKSHAMSTGTAPLDRLAAKAHEAAAAAMEAFAKELAGAKAKQKAIERALEKAAANNDDPADLLAQVKPLPEPPLPRRFKVTDATPEKLAALLVHNPNGLLLAVDELAGWLHGLERSGHEQERSFYLTGWSGKSSYDVDRIQRGSLHIPAVCLSVIGTIQPGVWSNYVREALGSKAGADGFLQRFQLAVWPDPLKHTRVVDQHPDHAAKNRSVELFDLLSHIDPKRIGAEASEFDRVPSLRFDSAAQPYAKQWIEAHRARWRNSTDHPALVAHMIKMQKTWSAVALVCHLVDWATGVIEDGSSGIGVSALEKAIGWVDYLESHARRIYGCGVAKDRSGLQVMAGKLRSGEVGDGFSEREVLKRHWAGLADHDSLDAVLLQLQTAAWIRPEKVKTKGRTKTAWRLHPRLIESAAKCSKLSPPCSDKSGGRVENGPLMPPSAACQAAKVS